MYVSHVLLAFLWLLMGPFTEDTRRVWIGTFCSRTLLQKTRRVGTGQDLDSDLAETEELAPLFRAAARKASFDFLQVPANVCHILGAVAIEPRERFSHRESGSLGEEARHQLTHFTRLAGRPLHGFALLFDVLDAVVLQKPVAWRTLAGRRGGSFFTQLESGQEARLRAELPPGDGHTAFTHPFQDVLRLPAPFAMLLLQRTWRVAVVPDLAVPWNHDAYGVFKGRKFLSGLTGGSRKRQTQWPALRRRFGKRPRLEETEAVQEAAASKQVDNIHDDTKLWGLADCVASMGNSEEVDPSVWRDFVEGMRYQHAESLLLGSRRHAYVAGKPSFAFRVGHLVEAMLCSMSLSHDDDLSQALQLAACLLLPDKLAKEWVRRLHADSRLYLPSKAIISQRRAALDMGYALLQQSRIKERMAAGAFFYALTDSSPQGGRDYEVTVLDIISAEDARKILFYVHSQRQCPSVHMVVCSTAYKPPVLCVVGGWI